MFAHFIASTLFFVLPVSGFAEVADSGVNDPGLSVECSFKNGSIVALWRGREFSSPANTQRAYNRCAANGSMAAYYDGSQFYVFDGRSSRFFHRQLTTSASTKRALVEAGHGYAGLFDGNSWIVFDAAAREFSYFITGEDYGNRTGMAFGRGIGVFYIMNIFVAYDGKSREYSRQIITVHDPKDIAFYTGAGAVLGYAVNQLHAYCPGSGWASRIISETNQPAQGFFDDRTKEIGMTVGGSTYLLNPAKCSLRRE